MKPVVLLPEKIADAGSRLLREHCDVLTTWDQDSAHARAKLSECDAVIVRLFQIGAVDLARCSRLKVIAKHGVGVDNVDVAAATARGVPVVYTPAANANAVAEHTVALMLALSRRIAPADHATRQGHFSRRTKFEGIELAERVLGVIGLGRVGSSVARIAHDGLRMRVLGYDPLLDARRYDGPAALVESLDALLPRCDVLTLHVPLSEQTRHLISDRTIALMKPTCRIINTSRGAIVDEAALVSALTDGRLAGAALDVFETEPLTADHPLCRAPNVLLTPHIASSTQESLERMAIDSALGVLDVLAGRRPQYLINPEALS